VVEWRIDQCWVISWFFKVKRKLWKLFPTWPSIKIVSILYSLWCYFQYFFIAWIWRLPEWNVFISHNHSFSSKHWAESKHFFLVFHKRWFVTFLCLPVQSYLLPLCIACQWFFWKTFSSLFICISHLLHVLSVHSECTLPYSTCLSVNPIQLFSEKPNQTSGQFLLCPHCTFNTSPLDYFQVYQPLAGQFLDSKIVLFLLFLCLYPTG
jgi:hypothetical protein